MRGLLEEQRIEVVGGAGTGAEAVQQVAELRPEVALVDIDLGGESGLDLARRLRDGGGSASQSTGAARVRNREEGSLRASAFLSIADGVGDADGSAGHEVTLPCPVIPVGTRRCQGLACHSCHPLRAEHAKSESRRRL